MRDKALLIAMVLAFGIMAKGQTVYLNSKQYDFIDGQWYQIEDGQQYLVNGSVITVRFMPGIPESDIESLNASLGTEVIRANAIGYYDLWIPDGADPLTIVEDYLNSGLVDVAEPNTFGEYIGDPDDPLLPNLDSQQQLKGGYRGSINDHDTWSKEDGYRFDDMRYYLEHTKSGPHSDELYASFSDSTLELIGQWLWGQCLGTAVVDPNHIAIGNGKLLQILDISDPDNIAIVGEVIISGDVKDIAVKGDYAYVVGDGGLDIINLTNFSHPFIVGSYSGYFILVCVDTRDIPYIYVGYDQFYVFDVSNPAEPQVVATISFGMFLDWDMLLYIDDEENVYIYSPHTYAWWVEVFEVTDPNNPTRYVADINKAMKLAIYGNYLLVSGFDSGIRVYSLANPTYPIIVTQWSEPAHSRDLVVVDQYLYTVFYENDYDRSWGIAVMDISDMDNPTILGTEEFPAAITLITLPVFLYNMVLANEKAYIASTIALWGVDLSNPSEPETQFYFPTGNDVCNIECQDQYAYLAAGISGLWILDMSDLGNPIGVGHFMTDDYAGDVVLQDTICYLKVGTDVVILTVSDPTNPSLMATIPDVHVSSQGMDVHGNYLYIPTNSTLVVVDVEIPSQPEIINNFSFDQIRDVCIQDTLAFIARGYRPDESSRGLYILDISDPSVPEVVGAYTLWGADRVEVVGSYAYVATSNSTGQPGYAGFAILDVNDPQNPVELSRLDTLSNEGGISNGGDLAISESWAYLLMARTKVINIEDKYNPVVVDTIMAGREDVTLYRFVEGRDIILVDSHPGISVYRNNHNLEIYEDRNNLPSKVMLYQNYPNPTNASTIIEYSLPKRQFIQITVFDILGRNIEVLFSGKQNPGTHQIMYNVDNLASGLYFYTLKTSGHTVVQKMLVIK